MPLIDFDGTLLFVSHDRYFINVATMFWNYLKWINPLSGWLWLLCWKKAELAASQAEEAAAYNQEKEVSPVNDYQAQKESQKELRKLMRQIENLEAEIEELETQAQTISWTNAYHQWCGWTHAITAELDKISQRQEEAMLEWEDIVGDRFNNKKQWLPLLFCFYLSTLRESNPHLKNRNLTWYPLH